MKKIILSVTVFQMITAAAFAQLTVQKPLTENRINPVGLDIATPRFSLQLASDKRGTMQTAYEIKVTAGT